MVLYQREVGVLSSVKIKPKYQSNGCSANIKLQNKAIKIINPTNMGSLEDHFQHLNILCLPKLYSFSVGKFMHSYHNKLLPNHFDVYFVPLSSIHYHSTRLATSANLFLPRVNSSSGKCSLYIHRPKTMVFNTRRY